MDKFKVYLFLALVVFTGYQISKLKRVSVADLNNLKPANQGVTLK